MRDEHPDIEQLAALTAGDLDASAATSVSAHVDECADCAADVTALRAVSDDLGTVADLPMPLDVAAALDSALETERLRTGGASVLPLRRRRAPRLAGLAAAASLVALVSAAVLGGVFPGDDDPPSVTSADGGRAAALPENLHCQTARNYSRDATALREQVTTLLRTGCPQAEAADSAVGAPSTAPGVQGTTSAAPGGTAAPFTSGSTTARSVRELAGASLARCVTALADGAPLTPVVVDYALFDGREALVVVLPTNRASRLSVFVVSAGCPDDRDYLRYFASINLPTAQP